MDTAKVFMNGRSQAIRLPKAYRFEGKEVSIRRVDPRTIVISESAASEADWDELLSTLRALDIEVDRDSSLPQQRENGW
jgi:antitoxin VapB